MVRWVRFACLFAAVAAVDDCGLNPVQAHALWLRRLHSWYRYETWMRSDTGENPPEDIAAPGFQLELPSTGKWPFAYPMFEYRDLFSHSPTSFLGSDGPTPTLFPQLDLTIPKLEPRPLALQFLRDRALRWALLRTPSLANDTFVSKVPNLTIEIEAEGTRRVVTRFTIVQTYIFERCSARLLVNRAETLAPDGSDASIPWTEAMGTIPERYWCTRIMDTCDGRVDPLPYANISDCVAHWATLPNVCHTEAGCDGPLMSGNTRTCRIVHLEAGWLRPAVHCQHVGRYGGPAPQYFCAPPKATDTPNTPTYTD